MTPPAETGSFDWDPPWLPRRAALTPDALAIETRDAESGAPLRLSYRALDERAKEAARSLEEQGVLAGQRVAVRAPGGLGFAVLAHALQRMGASLVPLNLRLTADELDYQRRDSRAAWSIEGVELAPSTEPRAERTLLLETSADGAVRVRPPVGGAASGLLGSHASKGTEPSSATAPLALLYTSGTTGRPKAAVLSHRAFAASAKGHAGLLGLEPEDRWLACMPLFHVGGLAILWRSVLAGSAVVLHEGFDAARAAEALAREPISIVSLVPTMLARLLDHWERNETEAAARAPQLRCALIGGAAASEALLEKARDMNLPIAPTYGMTEAASQIATRLPTDTASPQAERLVPLPGVELRIEDEEGQALPPRTPGSIAVRGPMLMDGYEGEAASGRGLDSQGWFRSGDLGELDSAGLLRVHERRDDLIVSGGENVYPAEIEAALVDHPAVADAGVVGVPDAEYGARPAAWIVPSDPERPPDVDELVRHCRARLAGYKQPAVWSIVDELPRNAGGKLVRAELRRRAAAPPRDDR